jgi:hypothetical protein
MRLVHMTSIFSHLRFLPVYSGVLTLAFAASTVCLVASHNGPAAVRAAEQPKSVAFDQVTVRRINLVEPDGTLRMVISNKSEFPGSFFKNKEIARVDRAVSAGMLFMNDEGTENGGLIFGGNKDKNGDVHSWGHLSFDEYQQDQTLTLDTSQDANTRSTRFQINDNGSGLITPEVIEGIEKIKAMPDSPEKNKAFGDFLAQHPINQQPRASMGRERDKSSDIRLRDPEGRTRILLRVAADGTPTMQFFSAEGKVIHEWPETTPKP